MSEKAVEDDEPPNQIMIHTNAGIPMVLRYRQNEIPNFNIRQNNLFMVSFPRELAVNRTPRTTRSMDISYAIDGNFPVNEKEDILFTLSLNSAEDQITWKVEKYEVDEMERITPDEIGKICRRIFLYVMDHLEDSSNILILYLKFFQLLYGKYQETLLKEIENFLEGIITCDYEKNKLLNQFLSVYTFAVDQALENWSPGMGSTGPIRPFGDDGLLSKLAQNFMEYLMRLLRRNRYIHFAMEEEFDTFHDQYPKSSVENRLTYIRIRKELENRETTFEETKRFLKKEKENHYYPTRELLYNLPFAMNHPVVMFEAVENYMSTTSEENPEAYRMALSSVECFQFLFPELILLLDETKQLQVFGKNDSIQITIDGENKTYRMLLERTGQDWLLNVSRFESLGRGLNEMMWANLAACNIYKLNYGYGVECCNFPVESKLFRKPSYKKNPADKFPFKAMAYYMRRDPVETFHEFLKKCKENGEYFYEWFFDQCEQNEGKKLYSKEFEDQESIVEYSLHTPLQDEMFYLQRFVTEVETVRRLFQSPEFDYQKKAFDIYCDYMNSTMKFGNLLIYYCCLKDYWNEKHLEEIKTKMKHRQAAEEYFLGYFQSGSRPLDNDFKNTSLRCPLAFYYVFVKVYMSKTIENNPQDQAYLLKLFCTTLHKVKNLRILMYNKNPEAKQLKRRIYHVIVSPRNYVPLEAKTIFNRDWTDVLNLYIWKAEINEYEKSTMTKVKDLERGASAVPAVVTVPDLAAEVVAKYFTSNQVDPADEIECLMKIQFNPHVVQIFGHIVDKGAYVGVLMEYCKGGSLEHVISSDKLYSEKHIVWWTMQAASGINFLHKKGILHRDIKPANMLLDYDHNLLKISDLGISKLSPDTTKPLFEVDFPLTKWFGTEGFVPTDTVDYYSAEIDVFALGRSIWSMIFRVKPVEKEVSTSLEAGVPRSISRELWDVVIRMIGPDKSGRPTMEKCYTSIKELHRNRNL